VRKSDVRRAVENKTEWQQRSNRSKEGNYILFRQGHRISRVTIPKGRDALPIGTLNSIRRQLLLDKEQFNEFVRCPLSQTDYARILDEKIQKGEI
jgi:predicted RNA binding protein YcfA (HicA-like mRNA interferase family)